MASAIELQGLAIFSVAVFWRGVAFLEEPILLFIYYLCIIYFFYIVDYYCLLYFIFGCGYR